jgi:hypothetical protein
MGLNHTIWRPIFVKEFAPQLSALVEALDNRVLPAFSNIEQEGEAHSDEVWETFMLMPGTGDEDPSDFAEAAEDAGVSRYMLLDGIRQGIVNLFAASLYHTFEQQVMLFLRREVLHPTEENNSKLFKMEVFCERLLTQGIDVTTFKSWPIIEELRLVANTVKHAEGKSALELHQIRPDFFRKAGLPGLGEWITRWQPRVFQPLVGKDLYVEPKDVRAYRDVLLDFWE